MGYFLFQNLVTLAADQVWYKPQQKTCFTGDAVHVLSVSSIKGIMWPVRPEKNCQKSCPKMISLEKLKILTPLQKLPKNVGDLGKLIVAKCFEKLLKVQ